MGGGESTSACCVEDTCLPFPFVRPMYNGIRWRGKELCISVPLVPGFYVMHCLFLMLLCLMVGGRNPMAGWLRRCIHRPLQLSKQWTVPFPNTNKNKWNPWESRTTKSSLLRRYILQDRWRRLDRIQSVPRFTFNVSHPDDIPFDLSCSMSIIITFTVSFTEGVLWVAYSGIVLPMYPPYLYRESG